MKTKLITLALTLGIASQVLAADTAAISASASVSNPIKKEKFPLAHLFTRAPKNENGRIERLGGMSSRPWAQIAGHAGENFSFMDAKNSEPNFTLVAFGAEP
jgi:hypothetical protein